MAGLQVGVHVGLGVVVGRNLVESPAFFVQAKPGSPAVLIKTFAVHPDRGTDLGERKTPDANERPVAQVLTDDAKIPR
jgi:hypothetical protein